MKFMIKGLWLSLVGALNGICRVCVVFAALLLAISAQATDITFGSFAIEGVSGSQSREKTAIKAYLDEHDLDCSIYDFGNAGSYFVNSDFSSELSDYSVSAVPFGYRTDKTTGAKIWNAFRYAFAREGFEVINNLSNTVYRSAESMAAVFCDDFGREYVLVNLRNTTYKKASYLTHIPGFLTSLRSAHPNAIMLISHNGRVARYADAPPSPYTRQSEYLDNYLVADSSGPQLTRIAFGAEGGFYIDAISEAKVSACSAADVIINNFNYTGMVARITVPTLHKIIFVDWDDTVLRTNIVNHGESVTPPTPSRPGFTFVGWEGRTAADFQSVTESFTARAEYATSGNIVTFQDWDETVISEVAVEKGATVAQPASPTRIDHTFNGWKMENGVFWNFADVVTNSMTLTADYTLVPELKIGSADDFLRLMAAGYPSTQVYTVTNDLDFTGKTIVAVDFAAMLDGDGHVFSGFAPDDHFFESVSGVIRNLTLNANPTVTEVLDSYGVLAKKLSGATIENVTIQNSNRALKKTNGYIGVLASSAVADDDGKATIVSNCTVRNSSVRSTGSYNGVYFGGFVAMAKNARFYNCRFLTDDKNGISVGGKISVSSGGIVGKADYPGEVDMCGCYAEGRFQVKAPAAYHDGVGGLIGGANGDNNNRPTYLLSACTNRATITGNSDSRFGGIVGMVAKANIRIEGCVNEGAFEIFGSNASMNNYHGAGGLLGTFWSNGDTKLEIADSVNRADVLVATNGIPVGGLVGRVNAVSGVMITNSFNYGNIESDIAAGGVVGHSYEANNYAFYDVGNSGNVTCTNGPAGGIIGRIRRVNSKVPFFGIMQNGAIATGTNYAGNVIGYMPGRFYKCENIVSNVVLAGSVTALSAEGQTGQIAGGVYSDPDVVHEMTWKVYNAHATDITLVPYYSRLNEPVTDVEGIDPMTVSQLMTKSARNWLNAGRLPAPWIRGRNFPELSLFAKEFSVGLQLIIR